MKYFMYFVACFLGAEMVTNDALDNCFVSFTRLNKLSSMLNPILNLLLKFLFYFAFLLGTEDGF